MPNYGISGTGQFMDDRRQMQRELNLDLARDILDIKEKIQRFRVHLSSVGLDPKSSRKLFEMIGQGNKGEWESRLATKLNELTASSKQEILQFYASVGGLPQPLNYILSSTEFIPGTTGRMEARRLMKN